ncbi:RNA methyltransferase [Leeia sp. TBRC 13508]|uniref:tRNA (cytidine/uridine-2'-O-)-methyltransferase TrmJ n=1 Tax=Leeia speluncae TaxID=2884804 RepID=A0ABS8D4F1_9NEIS|nr:RNA methyltransferase [Leeia speluncae]MCB6182523.1 RNA methyltransferase [Leeia speluncae]
MKSILEKIDLSADLPLNRIRVVLSHTSHPGNIGATARAMKNMGLSKLYLVNPKHFPDEEATTRASGAADVLENAIVVDSLAKALEGTVVAAALTSRRRELGPELMDARRCAAHLCDLAQTEEVALVFGNETNGLSIEEVSLCNLLVTIPTNPVYSSLNLAQAVQVLTYECRMAINTSVENVVERHQLATHEEIELFYQHLEQSLIEVGFLNPANPKRLMPRLRRLFGRKQLEKEEVDILRGMIKVMQKGKGKNGLES